MHLSHRDGAGPSGRELQFRLEGAHICDLRILQGEYDIPDLCLSIGKAVLEHCRATSTRPPDLILRFQDPFLRHGSFTGQHVVLRDVAILLWDPQTFDGVAILCPRCPKTHQGSQHSASRNGYVVSARQLRGLTETLYMVCSRRKCTAGEAAAEPPLAQLVKHACSTLPVSWSLRACGKRTPSFCW